MKSETCRPFNHTKLIALYRVLVDPSVSITTNINRDVSTGFPAHYVKSVESFVTALVHPHDIRLKRSFEALAKHYVLETTELCGDFLLCKVKVPAAEVSECISASYSVGIQKWLQEVGDRKPAEQEAAIDKT